MSKNTSLLLVVWNVILTAVIIWLSVRTPATTPSLETAVESEEISVDAVADTSALKDARIAFFFMDSIQANFDLVTESAARVRNEGRRLEEELGREMVKAQERVQQLASKDPTYSTQAERRADQEEFQRLQLRIEEMRESSQNRIDELQINALEKITSNIIGYLEEYNRTAGHDFIFSVQDGGQIWVGNKGLDITDRILSGLNEQHKQGKAAAKK